MNKSQICSSSTCVGPSLPKPLKGLEMVSVGFDLIAIGGGDSVNLINSGVSPDLFKLSCTYNICQWETLHQKLLIPRREFVAIPVPDHFINCN